MKRASAIFLGSATRSKMNSSPNASQALSSTSQPPQPTQTHTHPPYTDNPEYKIGGQVFHEPFVTVRQLKAHLSLLYAFSELRKNVDAGDVAQGNWINSMPKDLISRWAWFVGVAVERFEKWCEKIPDYDASSFIPQDEVPPIEVLMVWHAYLLNPRCYADDAARFPMLHNLRREYGNRLMAYILEEGQDSFNVPPNPQRSESWRRTGLSWHPFGGTELLNKAITCPECWKDTTVDLANRYGTGYIQDFTVRCNNTPTCRALITKDALGIHKLIENLRDRSKKSYLAGTVYYTNAGEDFERAKAVKQRAYEELTGKFPLVALGLNPSSYLKESVREALAASVEPAQYRMIMSAYTDDKPFSLDLVGAVLRQYSFVKKMGVLGWTTLGFFDDSENELVLRHAIARYHAFLDLMSSSPDTFLVPTLDIDLAWHTHQLLAIDYYNDCMASVGRFIDHDDKIEESTLSTAFDTTCRAWKDNFGLPYTYCGCPIPGDTIGRRLSRLVLHYRDSKASQHLLTPLEARRDSRAATHPSDHNAIYPLNPGSKVEASRTKWSIKGPGTKEAYRKRLEKEKRMKLTRVVSCDNYPAFLTPVPYTRQDWTVSAPVNSNGYSRSKVTTRTAISASSKPLVSNSSKRGGSSASGYRSGGVGSTAWAGSSYSYSAVASVGYADVGGAGCSSGGGDSGAGRGGGGCGGGGGGGVGGGSGGGGGFGCGGGSW